MRFFPSGGSWSIVAIFIVAAVNTSSAAAAASSTDWQFASSNGNAVDFNAPDEDWTLSSTNLFTEGSNDINPGIIDQSLSPDIMSTNSDDDNQQLFMDDGTSDPQTELLLADTALSDNRGGGECSASDNLAGKIRRRGRERRFGRRNAMCSVGIVTSGPTGTILDATTFDLLYCPVASILIRWLLVCSSPDPLKTVVFLGFSTLYESTRGKLEKGLSFFFFPSSPALQISIREAQVKPAFFGGGGPKTNQLFSRPLTKNMTRFAYIHQNLE